MILLAKSRGELLKRYNQNGMNAVEPCVFSVKPIAINVAHLTLKLCVIEKKFRRNWLHL